MDTRDKGNHTVRTAVGQTLSSVTDSTTVIVVRSPGADVEITCGGRPMVDAKAGASVDRVEADPGFADGSLLGKRYEDASSTIELLVTKGGTSSLAVDGQLLVVKSAKPLPASD
ncbi:hypothetical protein [uncultured Jatrophihabitans sp.]|uniref:hypothetical protein n=1 Tax=uncultured Jatrophihabitans sp. TaxID=1610747 RepID=UPI0035C98A1F